MIERMQKRKAFKDSLTDSHPPDSLPDLLKAMWYDGKGNWEQAHAIADGHYAPLAERVHAYLHRKEGDQGNAAYWYRRAGKPVSRESLDNERLFIAKELIYTECK